MKNSLLLFISLVLVLQACQSPSTPAETPGPVSTVDTTNLPFNPQDSVLVLYLGWRDSVMLRRSQSSWQSLYVVQGNAIDKLLSQAKNKTLIIKPMRDIAGREIMLFSKRLVEQQVENYSFEQPLPEEWKIINQIVNTPPAGGNQAQ